MYGKLFAKMYDGTLRANWKALVTFQQLIVLCDADGIVDMTPEAISARTGIPLDFINEGLEVLSQPDRQSRTPDEDGRRIELIDAHRPWGWHLVNHAKYANLRDADTIREQTRARVQRHREKRKKDQRIAEGVTQVTLGNAGKRHTDTDTDTEKGRKDTVGLNSKPDTSPLEQKARALRAKAVAILAFLNIKAHRNYQPVQANVELIVARLRDGATVEECHAVIAKKTREWLTDPKMNLFLRPATLFARTNFAQYQGELVERTT